MTFRGQVRWALTRGIAAVVVGAALAFVTIVFELYGYRIAQQVTGLLTVFLISSGTFLALLGGLARPAQRWALLHGLPAGRLRDVILGSNLLRRWYWVDGAGRARDD
ncbi:hypothetical protein [Tabrizicola sp.]|uniref:hypothetical protein n=1 Tax=Tabrizicola sp. TaxID=2005166 RepID=UPI002733FFF3|nr:hypothetical protein [Tabrizicola sp.]MDP3197279.1 hypothetical protein [Tabrizicola sp.]